MLGRPRYEVLFAEEAVGDNREVRSHYGSGLAGSHDNRGDALDKPGPDNIPVGDAVVLG